MTSTPKGLVNLTDADLDEPIYRIYPLERFKALVASRMDALVHPMKWDDPFENFMLARTEVADPASGTTITLQNLAEDWYGQCWSRTSESDAMWRIYSPSGAGEGIKVRTTIRKLFENLRRVGPTPWDIQFFVGRIEYVDQGELDTLMGSLTFSGVARGGQGDGFANLLCIKRDTFRHEDEVRLLFHDMALTDPPRPRLGSSGIMKYALDPNQLFDEVVLDPRLTETAFLAIKTDLVATGCRMKISKSRLYEVPSYVISM